MFLLAQRIIFCAFCVCANSETSCIIYLIVARAYVIDIRIIRKLYSFYKNILDNIIILFQDYISKISIKKFEVIKALFIEKRRAKEPKTLNDLSNAFWAEIWKQQYNFDRINVEINCLHEITLHELRSFFKVF